MLVPASLALATFFSWIMLVNGLRIPFYLYYERTIFLVYSDRSLDPVIWLGASTLAVVVVAARGPGRSASLWFSIVLLWSGIAAGAFAIVRIVAPEALPLASLATLTGCSLAVFTTIRATTSPSRNHFPTVFLLVLSLLVLPAELGSLLYYVVSAFRPGIEVGKSWELLELQLWYTAFPLIPFLYVAFLFSWIWAPLVTKMLPRLMRVGQVRITGGNVSAGEGRSWPLAGYVLLAFFLGYYAYFHDPSYPLVGTDIYWRNALPAQRVLSSSSWAAAAARERHPIVVLGLAIVSSLLGLSVESLLRFAYVGLILSLGAATSVLVLMASGSKTLASLSALMSTALASTTAGIYTGIVASWVALILWTLSLASLALGKDHGLRRYLISIFGLAFGSLAVLFVHPWTWIGMMVGLVAYLLIVIVLRLKGALRDLAAILIVVLCNAGALAFGIFFLAKMQGWRIAEAFSLAQNSLSSNYLGLGSWEIVVFFSEIWSQFLHPVPLILSTLGVLVIARRRDRFCAIVLSWVLAASVISLVAAPMGYDPLEVCRGETQIFRAIFLTPFQIPAALGFLYIRSGLDARLGQTHPSRLARFIVEMALGIVFLSIMNGAFRALFPLLTDPHNYPNPLAP